MFLYTLLPLLSLFSLATAVTENYRIMSAVLGQTPQPGISYIFTGSYQDSGAVRNSLGLTHEVVVVGQFTTSDFTGQTWEVTALEGEGDTSIATGPSIPNGKPIKVKTASFMAYYTVNPSGSRASQKSLKYKYSGTTTADTAAINSHGMLSIPLEMVILIDI